MKQKKWWSFMAMGTVLALAVTGCSSKVATTGESEQPVQEQETGEQPENTYSSVPVKTGLSIVSSVFGSADASTEADGLAQTNIALTAVTIDDQGVIDSCVIDAVQANISFDAEGNLLTDVATEFLSKNELGADYGLSNASSIGKEWNEQAKAMSDYVVGKTVEEVKSIAVDESGKLEDVDLAASVTITVGDFIAGIEDAASKAEHLGAQKGDTLTVETITNMSKSSSASAEADGVAQAYATIAAVTLKDDVVTSCHIDAVQANVNFDIAGKITSDLEAPIASKNELGSSYGMHKASSIGKDWHEQAAAFSAYVTGKTLDEVSGIAVNESNKAADADLAASVTIAIGDFRNLLEKAAK